MGAQEGGYMNPPLLKVEEQPSGGKAQSSQYLSFYSLHNGHTQIPDFSFYLFIF